MRLREMQQILRLAIPQLTPAVQERKNTGVREFTNYKDVIAAIQDTARVPALRERADALLQMQFLEPGFSARRLAQPDDHGHLQEAVVSVAKYRSFAQALEQMLAASLPSQNPFSVTIMLPDGTLRETAETLASLSEILNTLGGDAPTTISLQNLDNGSLDFEIVGQILNAVAVDPKAAITATQSAFATATFLVFHIARKITVWRAEGEKAITQAKLYGYAADDTEGNKNLAKALRDKARAELEKPDANFEVVTKYVNAAMDVSDHVQRGVWVYPALNAPTEMKALAATGDPPLLKKAATLLLTAGQKVVEGLGDEEEEEGEEPDGDDSAD